MLPHYITISNIRTQKQPLHHQERAQEANLIIQVNTTLTDLIV